MKDCKEMNDNEYVAAVEQLTEKYRKFAEGIMKDRRTWAKLEQARIQKQQKTGANILILILGAIILMVALIAISGCGVTITQEQNDEIILCMDLGGEWQGECVFEGEVCVVRAQCKPEAKLCSCVVWGEV